MGGRISKTCSYPAGGTCTGTTNTRTVTTTYDDLGQPTVVTVAENGTTRLTTTTTYNSDGTPSQVTDGTRTTAFTYYASTGDLHEVKENGVVITDYTYEADGKVHDRTDYLAYSSAFTYDWANRLTAVDYPPAGTVAQTWRLDGTLATKSWPTSPIETATVSYDAARRPTTITRTNGDALSRSHDRGGNVTAEGRSLSGGRGAAYAGSPELRL